MDSLDVRIIRTMGIVPYGAQPRSPESFKPEWIARELDVTAETIRKRIVHMERDGVIQGYDVYPNIRHLGLHAGAFLVELKDEDHRARFAQDGPNVEGLVDVFHFLGREACFDMCYRSEGELERKLTLLASLTGANKPDAFYQWPMPKVERQLQNLDWRIIKALRGRARRPLIEVAEEIGVSYRTVKRRWDQMAREGSIFTIPLVDPGQGSGRIPFVMLVHHASGTTDETRRRVLEIMDDTYVYNVVPDSARFGNFDLLAFAETAKQVEILRREVAAVEGVQRAEALITQEVTYHTEWIDEAIEERIDATAAHLQES